jgi:multidrug resistance efflux pump
MREQNDNAAVKDYTPVSTPWQQQLQDLRGTPLFLLVWLVALAVIVAMMHEQEIDPTYPGKTTVRRAQVVAPTNARIEQLTVKRFDKVEAGEVVAQLSAAIETAQAELVEAEATLTAARAEMVLTLEKEKRDWRGEHRRFRQDLTDRELKLLEVMVALETDKVARERLALQLGQQKKSYESGLVSSVRVDDMTLKHDRIVQRIAMRQELLLELERTIQTNRALLEDVGDEPPAFNQQSLEDRLAPLHAQVEVRRTQLAALQARLGRLTLRAPFSGWITEIRGTVGSHVMAGTSLVLMVSDTPFMIIAYLPEKGGTEPYVGQEAELIQVNNLNSKSSGRVVKIAPGINPVSERLWRRPGFPEYGHAFLVAPDDPALFVPDERVEVRILY